MNFNFTGLKYSRTVPIAVSQPPLASLVSASVGQAAPGRVVLHFSLPISDKYLPLPSAFAVSGHRVSRVSVWNGDVHLEVEAFQPGEASAVSYSLPPSGGLRDLFENRLGSFAPAAISNGLTPIDSGGIDFSLASNSQYLALFL